MILLSHLSNLRFLNLHIYGWSTLIILISSSIPPPISWQLSGEMEAGTAHSTEKVGTHMFLFIAAKFSVL